MQADVSKVEAATEYRWAKKGLILLSLPSLLALSLTPAYAASSSIEQVTIYQGLASVTRALPVKGNGEQTLVFSCLSPYIDKDSVSVQAVTGVNLGEVSIETLSGEQAAQCQYEGDANVQSQQAALAKINAELEAANLAKAYLQNLTKVSQISTEGTVANNARDIETQAVSINKRIWDIKQRQARAQAALNQSMAGSSTSTQNRVTQVSVRTASRKPAAVKLHYQVRGAGWQPTYQARLDTNTEQLSITASAIIAQQTGENWQNVPVVLSSVNPNQRTTGQLPNVARLSLYEKEPASRARVASSMMEPSSIVVSERSSSDDREGSAPMMAPLPSFSVSRQNKNGIIEYRLPQRVSLPSDGRHVRTVIDEQSGRSTLWIRSTPSVEQTAYWYASAPFLTPAWADGALQLYRDDNYIGQARYQYQTLKEQGIGFGVDPNILIKQITDEDKQGDKGAFNRKQTLSSTEAYQLTNQHSRTRRLQVLSSEPISRDDSIKVTTVHTPPVTERDWNDNTGMVAWEFDLPSKQSKVIRSTTQISYPADKKLRTN
ncbi:DUF4139 domain-containing protein [Psychrobacter celer]|uniref:DUF4139 domain-containing protein n=1 Tax=Psychrobacter celer TaxID=306572 RepID=UPI003FD4E7F4